MVVDAEFVDENTIRLDTENILDINSPLQRRLSIRKAS